MRKLRFKNRNGVLYFGLGDTFKSSKMKDTKINRNILLNQFRNGKFDEVFEIGVKKQTPIINDLILEVMSSKELTLKHGTLRTYRAVIEHSILPYYDGKHIIDIQAIDIKNWQDYLIKKGYKNSSISMARGLLKDVFSLAIIKGLIKINPIVMIGLQRSKEQKEIDKPFTLDEIDLILKYAPDASIRNFFGISFFTGMRGGEVLALTWQDIDFDNETISINKTVSNGLINSPKTASSCRDIEMLPKAKEFFKNQQLQTGIKNGFVFLNHKNRHYPSTCSFYVYFQTILKNAGLTKTKMHNTRHTFASLMLNNGIDPMWVSNMLGHNSLDITLKIYAHFMPKKEKMKIEFLEKRYKNGTTH